MKLSNLILKAIFIVSFISILIAFFVSISIQYNTFKEERDYIKKEFIDIKKYEIQNEIQKVYNLIQNKKNNTNKKLRNKLKNRVELAHSIASTLYNQNKNKKTKQEIEQLIVTTLKNINLNEKRAYFFINTNKGKAVLYNKNSLLNKNKDIWNLKDKKGSYIIRKQTKIAREQKEGFITNYFIKPDLKDNKQYPKLSFIKNFEPFNWHIGTGEYLDDALENTKQIILEDIANIRYGKDGYIFVNTLDKQALVFDGKKLETPKMYPSNSLFAQQLNAIKNKDGGFFFYKFKKLNTPKRYLKLTFVKKFEEWDWIIGTGVYIDNIDNVIKKEKKIFESAILHHIETNLLIIILLAVLVFLISKRISLYIDKNIMQLVKSFKNAAISHELIETEHLSFKEFTILGKNLNKILQERNLSEKELKNYIDIVNDNIIISRTDEKGIITDISNAFCKISGYTKKELIGKNHDIIKHPEVEKEVYKDIWSTLKSGKAWKGELKNKKKNSESYWIDVMIQPNYKDNQISGYTSIRHDITNKKKIEYLSITDELTQLYNRRHFNTKIEEELNRAKRDDYYFSFIMLDIDYFKKYNDTYGHQEGDEALKKVSLVLKSLTNRASDFAFRIGGEEFAILLSYKNKEESYEFALSIKKEIKRLNIKHTASKVSPLLTISIGIISKKVSSITDSKELYKLADEELYRAKEEGRDRICIN
jgi:diguanylate cyclase (GGDEF)-like protein/PAS domain S-box-containing protein